MTGLHASASASASGSDGSGRIRFDSNSDFFSASSNPNPTAPERSSYSFSGCLKKNVFVVTCPYERTYSRPGYAIGLGLAADWNDSDMLLIDGGSCGSTLRDYDDSLDSVVSERLVR